jgi:hypothetical protein
MIEIRIAEEMDSQYTDVLCAMYEESAKQRGTGIAKRNPDYLKKKMQTGNSVIAFVDGELAAFCYIEVYEDEKFVVNSGLIVHPEYRRFGLAKKIKAEIFRLSRVKYPDAKLFGITTSFPVMKINTELGYTPVTFSELTTSDAFWDGCKNCKNYGILMENQRKMCLCTGMLYDNLNDALGKWARDEKERLQREQQEVANQSQDSNNNMLGMTETA